MTILWLIALVGLVSWARQLTRERMRSGFTLWQAILPGLVLASFYGLFIVASMVENAQLVRSDTAVILLVLAALSVLAFALIVVRYERRLVQRLRARSSHSTKRSPRHRR